ncbi:MAG: FimV/HubP family polar landmark protein [Pseudomonadota bacterium]
MLRWLAAIVVAACLSLGQSAWALGLGEITTRSALNEPMVAQIALLGATQEELSGLEIRLASAETFERYGIDKPSFLTGFKFRVRPGAQPYVEVTSSQPISEPFVTMLVEAVWPRGRLLREYTVLLDPPTFKAPAAASPAPAIRSGSQSARQANQGNIRRSARAQSSPAPSRSISGNEYQVQRNDTLWEIARSIQPNDSVSINQVMVAIYEANPQAFAGNINRLNAGAVLRLPTERDLVAINRSAALQEVRRQNQNWRGEAGGSLTLVAPDEDTGVAAPATSSSGSSNTTSAVSGSDVAALRRELAERDNQLRVQNEELARLQAALAERQAASDAPVSTDGLYGEESAGDTTAETAATDTTTPDTSAVGEVFAETDDPVATEDSQPADTDTSADATSAEATTEAPAQPAATEPQRRPAAVVTTREEPSLIEKLTGSIWTYVGAGVLAILALLGLLARRRAADADDTGTWEALDSSDLEDLDGTLAATGRLRELGSKSGGESTQETPAFEDPFESTSPVDEISREAAESDAAATMEEPALPSEEATEEYSIEDTFSSDTAINFDQSDPLAEADFHMAYGLYDQAADLVKGALAVDANDNKLKAKLCEIYFVWGNQDGFVDAAKNLRGSLPEGDPDWNKVVIMGQQIAPAHELFSGAAVAASVDSDVDISLDAETMLAEQLDIGESTGGFTEVFETSGDGTVEQPADLSEISGIDFEFDESSLSGNDDAVVTPDETSASGVDFQFDGESIDDGTVEQPIDLGGVDTADETREERTQTAEMDLADLDLDTGDVEALVDIADDTVGTDSDLLEATGATSVLPDDFKVELPDDDATVLASSESFDLDKLDATGTTEMPSLDALNEADADEAADATGIMPMGAIGEVDMDVADLTSELSVDDLGAEEDATMEQPALDSSSTMFSEQVFGGDNSVDSAADTGLNLALEDTGETNIAEVGTKLDLARAYVDMGDPDGARSILDEVLSEGDDEQKAEAQKLLDNLS